MKQPESEEEFIKSRVKANQELRNILNNNASSKQSKDSPKGLDEDFISILDADNKLLFQGDFLYKQLPDESSGELPNDLKQEKEDLIEIAKAIPDFAHPVICPSISRPISFYQKLHLECVSLIEWLEPTPLEEHLQMKVCKKIEVLTKMIWNTCEIKVFGSKINGLSLPDGDIDICLMDIPGDISMNLKLLAHLLIELGIAKSLELILTARVPILKFIDEETNMLIDISINQNSSCSTSAFIDKKLNEFYHMKPLILLLKLYLNLRGLNETYLGSVGSFLLSMMVLSFLQLHPSSCDSRRYKNTYLSHLLIDFFFVYGFQRNLEYLSSRGLGHLFPRTSRNDFGSSDDSLFSFENPLDIDVDIGRSAFNSKVVRKSFQNTFTELYILSTTEGCSEKTILSHIYDYTHPYFTTRPNKLDTKNLKFPDASELSEEISNDLVKRLSYITEKNPKIMEH